MVLLFVRLMLYQLEEVLVKTITTVTGPKICFHIECKYTLFQLCQFQIVVNLY